MNCRFVAAGILACFSYSSAAMAGECAGNPDALGTSRVITLDPAEFQRIGTIQYKQTLPLEDHEVVLTFDDGPIPPNTDKVLDALAAECVKATFFIVRGNGQGASRGLAASVPRGAHHRHAYRASCACRNISAEKAQKEILDGIASVAKLGRQERRSAIFPVSLP